MRQKLTPASQYTLISDPEWKTRSCGITALYILLAYYLPDFALTGDALLKLGLDRDAYIENVGWKHKELAQMAGAFGLFAENYDWYAFSSEDAFQKLVRELEKGPVIASTYKHFDTRNGGHLIVVVKVDAAAIHIIETAEEDPKKIEKRIPLDTFLHGWKRRIIVVRPKAK